MAELHPEPEELMSFPRRLANILGLAMGWCLMVSVMFIQLSTTTLAARDYAGASTSTLPAGIMMAAATLSAVPGSLAMRRFGRRPVLAASAVAGVAGGGLLIAGALLRALGPLIAGSVPLGVCFGQANCLRFAATEFAPAGWEARALSAVVSGAVLSAVMGPEVAKYTRTALAPTYTATYVFLTGLCVAYAALVGLGVEFGRLPALVADKELRAQQRAAAAEEAKAEEANAKLQVKAGTEAEDDGDATASAAAAAAETSDARSSGNDASSVSTVAVVIDSPPPAPLPGWAQLDGPGCRPASGGGGEVPRGGSALGAPAGAEHRGDSSSSGGGGGKEASRDGRPPRPLRDLLLSWGYAVPVLTASLSYCGMAAMMSATPLASRDSGYNFNEITQVIQVHIIAMFLPSFLTGDVIALLGAAPTMTLGSAVLLAGTAVFFAGGRLPVFFAGNAVVGLGWNWSYVGASALVAKAAAARLPASAAGLRFVAQGAMDSAVLAGTGVAVVLAGTLYSGLGWTIYAAVYVGCAALMVAMDVALLGCDDTKG